MDGEAIFKTTAIGIATGAGLLLTLMGFKLCVYLFRKLKSIPYASIPAWYINITKKQRNVVLLSALLLMAIPIVGWFFIAPWMLPLLAYLEYRRP